MVIINQALAKQFWPNSDPLNDRMIIGQGAPAFKDELPRQIIGVVGDVRVRALNRDPLPNMYVHFGQPECEPVGLGDPDSGGANVVEFRDSE